MSVWVGVEGSQCSCHRTSVSSSGQGDLNVSKYIYLTQAKEKFWNKSCTHARHITTYISPAAPAIGQEDGVRRDRTQKKKVPVIAATAIDSLS